MATALIVLAISEWLVEAEVAGVLAGARAIVVLTFGILLSAPLWRSPLHTPDIVVLILATAALGIDALAAAVRFAPALMQSSGSVLGMHLLAAFLTGAAAGVLGIRLATAELPIIGAVLLGLGAVQMAAFAAVVHGVAPTSCYVAVLGAQGVSGLAYLIIPALRRQP